MSNFEQQAATTSADVDAGEDLGDEHGDNSRYLQHLLDMMSRQEQVLALVRLSFVVSLHHYFEKQILDELGIEQYTQSEAFSLLKGYGWKPLEIQLNELRLATNCAKHSKGQSAKDLHALRPDMFDAGKIKMGFEPGYDSLALSDAHVESFFEAVRKSVPSNLGIAF